LTFIGTTRGYAGEMLGGWYGPILPKASVDGNLTLNDDEIEVGGLGYLEHGWDIPLPVWQYGWFFGKFVSDSFTIMWGRMMYTRWYEGGKAAILSKDGEGFIAINPKNFTFTPTKYRYNNGEFIPTKFIFNLSDPGISINVTMDTINLHHFTSLAGLSDCWRYHVRVNGQITYGNTTEIIKDKIQIMGIMRFR
jgi:predicted secreted hydrolase